MTTISATVIADSVSFAGPEPKRITTLRCRYPRWIHAEGRTHRQLTMTETEFPDDFDVQTFSFEEMRTPSPMEDRNLSRNASSSRAIPVKCMIDAVRADPAVPLFWGSNQRGMQAGEECNEPVLIAEKCANGWRTLGRETSWLEAMEHAIEHAEAFAKAGYHKQIVNRLLEPFMHIDVLFTATEWSNFFALRIHEAAEPHIRLLAERMRDAMAESMPIHLKPGDWHLPYVSTDDLMRVSAEVGEPALIKDHLLWLSVARCAHLSYETVGMGRPINLEQARRIYNQLLGSQPIHASPAEHQATPDTYDTLYNVWGRSQLHGNFVGWRQYRKMLPGECQ